MSQDVIQSVAAKVVVILTDANVAVTGLAFGDVTAQFAKNGAGSFSGKVLDGTNFDEVGQGIYTIEFTAAELDTLGAFTVVVTGADIDQSTTIANVVAADAETVTTPATQLCTLVGHVVGPQGSPKRNVSVNAMIFGQPAIEQNQLAVSDDLITVQTDANGYFQISLLRLAEVELFIPAVNYRRRLTVPNQSSANLFTEVA